METLYTFGWNEIRYDLSLSPYDLFQNSTICKSNYLSFECLARQQVIDNISEI